MENVLDQTAITYPYVTLTQMTGEQIKQVLEDVCDNLFNADPYYQQGGDMVRVGGMSYACDPTAAMGQPHRRHDAQGQADRRRQDLQGRGLGAGLGGRERRRRRTDLGPRRPTSAGEERRSRRRAPNLPKLQQRRRQSRHGDLDIAGSRRSIPMNAMRALIGNP